MAHPDFFQHALRSGIPREVRRMDPVQPKRLEPKRDRGACRFRRKTLAPVRDADPIAEFRAPVRRRNREADDDAEFAGRRNRDGKGGRPSRAKFFLSVCQKTLRIVFRVGMRNVCGCGGDFVRSRKTHDGGEVATFNGAQQESRSPQFLRSGHATLVITSLVPLAPEVWRIAD